MTGLTGTLLSLALALTAFVGSHYLMSHPLRAKLVTMMGEQAFRGLYSVVAMATFVWIVLAYRAAPYVVWWPQLEELRWPVNIVMACAVILLVGGFLTPNPFTQSMTGKLTSTPVPKGVFVITRHPLMWSVGLWALAHAAINGDGATVLLAIGMGVLALSSGFLQDRKLAKRLGAVWTGFVDQTSSLPFVAVMAGKSKFSDIGIKPVAVGLVVYALIAGGHPFFTGVRALPLF